MTTLNTAVVLFLGLFAFFIPLATSTDDVNIAAAYSAEINDGWARYLYWQQPRDRKIVVRRQGKGMEEVEIVTSIKPRRNSPLAAHYITQNNSPGEDNVGFRFCFLAFILLGSPFQPLPAPHKCLLTSY